MEMSKCYQENVGNRR